MRISAHVHRIVHTPPWFVRVFGVVLLGVDVFWWLGEHAPTTWPEIAKHGMLLAIGLACFYPEALILVGNTARKLPLFDRRTEPRPPKTPIGPTEP